jgi:hypothetical protein
MRRSVPFILAVLSAAAPVAVAQSVLPPVRPYTAVAITLPPASTDASFIAFRAQLAAVAKSRIFAALGPLVRSQEFFWERDFQRSFDPRRPAVDNLAAAVRLEHHGGSGWDLLAELASEGAVEPMSLRPGVVCAPAGPKYDSVAFARLVGATYTGMSDWLYPRVSRPKLRSAPLPGAATLGTLGSHFVRLLGFQGLGNGMASERKFWARVATPEAKIGYAAPGILMSLAGERLCYFRELMGGWRVAGIIAAGE